MNGNIGEKIRALREEAEMNQTELGRKVNMTQRKVSYIECGKIEPNIEDITEFCRFFKVSSDYLIGLPYGLKYPER